MRRLQGCQNEVLEWGEMKSLLSSASDHHDPMTCKAIKVAVNLRRRKHKIAIHSFTASIPD
jgi:hypothetical protein